MHRRPFLFRIVPVCALFSALCGAPALHAATPQEGAPDETEFDSGPVAPARPDDAATREVRPAPPEDAAPEQAPTVAPPERAEPAASDPQRRPGQPTLEDERAVEREVAPRAPDPPPAAGVYMSDWRAAALQYLAGTLASGVCCGGSGVVGAVIAVVLFVLPGGIVWSTLFLSLVGCAPVLAAPAAGGTAGVWLREWWGGRRGTWAWPVLAAYATELVAAGVMAAATLTGALLAGAFFTSIVNFNDPEAGFINAPQDWAWVSLGSGGAIAGVGFFGGLLAAILAPALMSTLTYSVTSEEKGPFDTGFRMPGLFDSNPLLDEEDALEPSPKSKRRRKAPARAMRF